ncbi:uncharacterized protein EV422DRAFT_93355 [Fimicolochytrium jonesii]|uniref:uncharacterized protein n=1 Tax=Fimicolochytrium jonesii TaxID=1396493 RepID=UPI0022FE930A|nr:uncharacterized protein EV422DRAFT_93355 [Fimicolochytrium jonesii]KAI8819958.1 hypothetical protein EV422DRAFT_93355 [Fimicolochytrium jonesii]
MITPPTPPLPPIGYRNQRYSDGSNDNQYDMYPHDPRARHNMQQPVPAMSPPPESYPLALTTTRRPRRSSWDDDDAPSRNRMQSFVSATQEREMQRLHERLTESERSQRELSVETARLHGALGQSYRMQEAVMGRDDRVTNRLFEDHFHFLRTLMSQTDAQTNGILSHLQHERETTSHVLDMLHQHAAQQSSNAQRLLSSAIEAARHETAELIKTELSGAGFGEIVGRIGGTAERVQREIEELRGEVGRAQSTLGALEPRVTAELWEKTEGFVKTVSQALHDEIGRAVAHCDGIITEMRTETATKRAVLEQEVRATTEQLQRRVEELSATLASQHERIDAIEHGIHATDAGLREMFHEYTSARASETREVVRSLKVLSSIVVSNREEERRNRESTRKILVEEFRKEMRAMKEDLETEIQQKIKPFIVV